MDGQDAEDGNTSLVASPSDPEYFTGRLSFLAVEQSEIDRRVHLSHQLKTILGDLSFGPGEPGVLVRVDFPLYPDGDDDVVVEELLKSAKPFFKLNYTEGRKYTFGTCYKDRQSQGDFVYRHLRQLYRPPHPREETYFVLECREQCLWISGSPDQVVLSHDGVIFLTMGTHWPTMGGPVRLEFGNIVTLCDDEGWISTDFLFKPIRPILYNPTRLLFAVVVNNPEKEVVVLKIPLVVERILHFLPSRTLKGLRSLSQTWNHEALRRLQNRSDIVMTLLQYSLINLSMRDDPLLWISDFMHSALDQLTFTRWNVVLPWYETETMSEHPRKYEGHWNAMSERKILDDLQWLFEEPRNIQILHLTLTIDSEVTFRMFQALLSGVQATVTTLHLDNFTSHITSYPRLAGEEDVLPLLRHFSISLGGTIDQRTCLAPFLQWFTPRVRNIVSLHVKSYSSSRFCPLVLEEMSKSGGNHSFVLLTQIVIDNAWHGNEQLKHIVSLRENSLKTLELGNLPNETTTQLRPALQRHEGSLEVLSLNYNISRGGVHTLVIPFPPRMPRLTTLSVFLRLGSGELRSVSFGRDDERINYNRRLPSLSSLTLWPVVVTHHLYPESCFRRESRVSWRCFLPAMDAFTSSVDPEDPSINLPVRSLRQVDIPFLLSGEYHAILDNLEVVFPNVAFPSDLVSARATAP